MRHVDLLLNTNREMTLDSFVAAFFLAAGVKEYQQRESSHYVEGRYFKGQAGSFSFKVMLSDDDDHADLPFWVRVSDTDTDEVNMFVRKQLLPAGFRVALLTNIGQVGEERIDYTG